MKIKFNGMTLRVTPLKGDEVIGERCLQRFRHKLADDTVNSNPWKVTTVPGDKVSEHPDREYVRVESKFFR